MRMLPVSVRVDIPEPGARPFRAEGIFGRQDTGDKKAPNCGKIRGRRRPVLLKVTGSSPVSNSEARILSQISEDFQFCDRQMAARLTARREATLSGALREGARVAQEPAAKA